MGTGAGAGPAAEADRQSARAAASGDGLGRVSRTGRGCRRLQDRQRRDRGACRSAPKDKPFFIACGFRLPHVPCYAPQKWFDLYPDATLQMPPVLEDDRDDTPRFSWYLHWKLPEPRLKTLREYNEWRPLVRAYLASTSFMDARSAACSTRSRRRAARTTRSSCSGATTAGISARKLITGKNTLWDRSTRVPLVFAGPGIARGAKCGRPAELLDIFPTLLELAGLPARSDLEGHSLVPQLQGRRRPARVAGDHHAQPRQPRHPHRAVALHPLRRRLRGTLRHAGRPERVDEPGRRSEVRRR